MTARIVTEYTVIFNGRSRISGISRLEDAEWIVAEWNRTHDAEGADRPDGSEEAK